MSDNTNPVERRTRRKPDPTMPARWQPKFLDELDSRLALVKRLRQMQEDVSAEVNADTIIKRILVDRLSFLVTMLETIEAGAVLEGRLDTASAGQWIQATNSVQGLARMLGFNRVAKKVGNLRDYVNAKQRGAAAG